MSSRSHPSLRLIRHPGEMTPELQGCVVALGNFDGVHRGHQAVIEAARQQALRLNAPLAVMTFEPHPRSFFSKLQNKEDAGNFRLTPLRAKARLIGQLGVDFLYAQHFDAAFAETSAEDFITHTLVDALKVRHVVVGYDYVFGKGRGGDGALLAQKAEQGLFGFTAVDALSDEGGVLSSSRVRRCLADGDLAQAAQVLGHHFEIEGKVEHGDARGRTIGFPTANLDLAEYQRPRFGVYSVFAKLDDDPSSPWMAGVANLGKRPTFNKMREILEVHLLDRSIDLYGRPLRVALVDFLRPEQKFDGLEALKSAIFADCQRASTELALRDPMDALGPFVK